MEFIAPLPCLENIVGLVWVNHSISPAVLPSKPSQLASVVFWGFVAQAPNVVARPGVNGDASEIINGVCMPKDNIPIGIAVLFGRVHSVAVAVGK